MPFIKRLNKHQLHFEDLVLLGPEGLEELNDKIEGTIETLENNSERINLSTKIDGAPALVIWHEYPGYPDNSVALKGFLSGPQNAISTPEQVDAKYGDRPGMSQMLKYGLQIAKEIPSGEAWQGDCLFVKDTKREEEINGKDYITFQPNKIIYAFSEDNPGYEKVKNADFGIAFHTIYTGEDKHQSFKVDPSKLNVPDNIYIMSPTLNRPKDVKVFNLDGVKSQFDKLQNLEQKLLSSFEYEDLVNNQVFMKYWNTFENANLADKKSVTINENTFINDLKEYIKDKRTKEFETQVGKLKTDAGKEKAKTKYEQDLEDLRELIDHNKDLLTTLVQTLNCAATIKMLLWQGFKQTQFDYNTFYRSRTKGYIPGEMEGVAMSDQDGNIVKIVDRSTFSSYNRDPDILAGFDHPENLTEEQSCFIEKYNKELTECGTKQLWERFGKLLESDQKTAVVAFGRMNPPTIGHQKLVDKMASLAQGEKAKLFLSHTQDKKKNPLSYEDKIHFAKEAFEPQIDVVKSDARTIIEVLTDLYKEGVKNIIYVGGEDRIGGKEDVSDLILRYNGQPDKQGNILYDFDSIQFKNAGSRSDDSDDFVERASASLARKYAQEGDFKHFSEIVPFSDADAKELYKKVRSGLGLSDEILTEANFSYPDILKTNHSYYLDVVDDFLSDGVVGADNNIYKIKPTQDAEEVKNELISIKELVGKNNQEFNKKFKDITGVEWTKIYKGKYSGHTNGQSSGEAAEAVVSYLYNNPGKDLPDGVEISDKWITSSKNIANFLENIWPHENYFAIHVNGNDLEPIGEYKNIGKLFKSKTEAASVLGLKNELDDLYVGGKDTWNKADILLVKKGAPILKYFENIKNSSDYNERINQLASGDSPLLIPVSLKGVSNRTNLTVVPEGFESGEVLHAKDIKVVFPIKPLEPETNNCSCWLIDNLGRRIQFRRQTDTEDNLSVEVSLNKDSRGGKGITRLKKELGLSNNEWYKTPITSENELYSKLRNLGELSKPSDNFINGNTSGEYAWYNRTCFRGITSLFEEYQNKFGGSNLEFFDWIYENSTIGTSGFYLVY